MDITIDIVIVNWNAGQQLEDCVQSIFKCGGVEDSIGNIIIVDNASSDGSMDFVRDLNSGLVKPVYNKQNEGFAKACNIGASYSSTESDHILFLNPDTILFEDTISKTVKCIKNSRNSIGIYGIRLCNEEGQVSTTCSRFPSLLNYTMKAFGLLTLFPSLQKMGGHMTDFNHLEDKEVDQVIGAFYIIKKHVFNQLTGFDEDFFVYYEEVDLCYRANKVGQKTFFFTEPSAIHIGGGTSSQVKDKRLFYNSFSRILYFRKHFRTISFLWVLIGSLTIEPITRMGYLLAKGDLEGCKQTLKGFYMLYSAILRSSKNSAK